jgi:hypothetical protein
VTARPAAPTVVLAGALAQRPGIGGHAWVFRNWLAGLGGLGYDVVFVDRLEPHMVDDPAAPPEASRQWAWLEDVMNGAGMAGRFALLYDGGRRCLGLDRAAVVERCRRATVLFNVMGYLDDEGLLGVARRRVFVDIDPGFPQFWRTLGLHDAFAGHDAFVTVGANVGRPGCAVPDCGLEWIPTLPPVDLAQWPEGPPLAGPAAARLTSVATWRGPFGPVEHDGTTYGLRVHEFRRFADLPAAVPHAALEVALDADGADGPDVTRLEDAGWRIVDPRAVAGDPVSYRAYVAGSAGEFLVAKQMYVRTGGGWVSDRSACYLASGRPVVAQDTGLAGHLPVGEGLLTFTDPDGAAAAVAEVTGNASRHGKAARHLAAEYFDAATVLRSLLDRLEVE